MDLQKEQLEEMKATTSRPTATRLWRTVLEETNVTLPVERAEKTIHPCAAFPYEGVIESDGT